jgi:hypothetical protein
MPNLLINLLATTTALLCAVLLLRAYLRTRLRLLLWSGLCFGGTSLSNALLFVDLRVFPELDLYPLRLGVAAASLLLLHYGLVFESDAR